MDEKVNRMELEEVVTTLVDSGAEALLYTEELAGNGALQMNVYPSGDLREALLNKDSEALDAEVKHACRIVDSVDAVTVNGETYPLWIDIAEYGIDTLGTKPLYLPEKHVSPLEYEPDATTIEDGLAAVIETLENGVSHSSASPEETPS